jgi:hypothetical protein
VAAAASAPISGEISLPCTQAPSSSNDVLSCGPRLRATHATARVHHAGWRRGDVAAGGARAAARVHAVALHSAGRRDEAVTVLKESLTKHPNDRDTLTALTNFSCEAGDIIAVRLITPSGWRGYFQMTRDLPVSSRSSGVSELAR